MKSGGAMNWRVLRAPVAEVHDLAPPLSQRSQGVLLRLLLEPNRPVPTDLIIDFLWGESPPKTARNSVARFVADLRRHLGDFGPRVATIDGGYRIDVADGELDIAEINRLLDASRSAEQTNVTDASAATGAAVALLGQPGLSPLAPFHGTAGHVARHEALHVEVLQRHAELQLQSAEHLEAIPSLMAAVDAHPFHEPFWVLLMTALHRSGRSVEALRSAQRLREVLVEVGTVPGHEAVRIEQSILDQQHAGQADPVPQQPQPLRAHDIAEPTTSMVGRAVELRSLLTALRERSAVTVVGLGGAGKTRLALAAARSVEAEGCNVHRVGLRSITDPRLVSATIAAAVGVPPNVTVSDPEQLAQHLRDQKFLLVLDNCEHLQAECSAVLDALGCTAPAVRVLATSRVPLTSAHEAVFHLGALDVPALNDASADSSSVALLMNRAETHLDLSAPQPELLRQLCDISRAVGGLPLALELAAAQLVELSPAALLARVNVGAQAAMASSDPALTTLTNMLEWSWDSLPAPQQRLLARLSVFASGWTVASASAVCCETQTVVADLNELVRTGLVLERQHLGESRFEILEPVREFAKQRLAERGETGVFLDRLSQWLIDLTAQHTLTEHHAYAHLSERLLPEHGNIAAALAHLEASGRADDTAWLACNSSGIWLNHGFADNMVQWLTPLGDDQRLSARTRSAVLAMLTAAHHTVGNLDVLGPLGVRALEEANGEPHEWVTVLAGFLGMWSFISPMEWTPDELHEMALRAAELSDAPDLGLAVAAMYRGHVDYVRRDYATAAALFNQAKQQVDHPGRVLMIIEVGEAMALLAGGRRHEAAACVQEWRSVSDTDEWHYIVNVIRCVVNGAGDDAEQATADLAQSIRRLPPAGVWGRVDEIQVAFGLLAAYRGEHELSTHLLSQASARDTLLVGLEIEHLVGTRGLDTDEEWFDVAQEVWTKVLPSDHRRGSTSDLLSLWTDGEPTPLAS